MKTETFTVTGNKTAATYALLKFSGTGPVIVLAYFYNDNSTSSSTYAYCGVCYCDTDGTLKSAYLSYSLHINNESNSNRIAANVVAHLYIWDNGTNNTVYSGTESDYEPSSYDCVWTEANVQRYWYSHLIRGGNRVKIVCRSSQSGNKGLKINVLLPSYMTVTLEAETLSA